MFLCLVVRVCKGLISGGLLFPRVSFSREFLRCAIVFGGFAPGHEQNTSAEGVGCGWERRKIVKPMGKQVCE